MELGDDEQSGQKIDPDRYVPKTLAGELRRRGKLPLDECLKLSLALAEALEHLHQHGLIHRDIKPANVIFVKGAPKFADLGLVTELSSSEREASYLGTEGYIAPEGPGTAAADVYSLGKLIYEASMGRDRRAFPELPTAVLEDASQPGLDPFIAILLKACEPDSRQRYPSAAALHADLARLHAELAGGHSPERGAP
jgi:serine/threonine protein kinase